jgi:membrane protein DedA with SNARE-associated domain
MHLGPLIHAHGYWVLALGCLAEGESVVLLAGLAARHGDLALPWVMAVAAVSGFAGDQLLFWLGRRHAPAVLARWPALALQAGRVHALLARYQDALVVGVRFAYGLRIAGPLLIGASPMPAWRFALFNALGALGWAVLLAALGWGFGEAMRTTFGHVWHLHRGVA